MDKAACSKERRMETKLNVHAPSCLPVCMQETTTVQNELKGNMEEFDKTGGSMHWDGGDDCTNTPLENIMMVNHKGPIFHTAVPGDGEYAVRYCIAVF